MAVGYLTVILVGSILLALPFVTKNGQSVGLLNALFTSTSATCVTGLTVVNTANTWNILGQLIIMVLMQIGGMGFVTFTTMFMILAGKKITLRERLLISESLNQNEITGMVLYVEKIVMLSLILEGIAAVILGLHFAKIDSDVPFIYAMWMGLFHSVSAFNNAGFDIIGDASFTPYVADVVINITISTLIILGGLGYGVWVDVIRMVKINIKEKNFSFKNFYLHLNLHTKLALEISIGLIVLGAVFFFFAEFNNPNTMGDLTFLQKIGASFFQSVSPRTAGFNTINQSQMTLGSQIITVILMFIGGSPGSTAGGIKTVTLAVIFVSIYSMSKGKSSLEIHGKSINSFFLQKAVTVVILNLLVIIIATTLLSITERHTPFGNDFMSLLFETTSSVGTVGLTLGITPYLTQVGRVIIIICMFIGRVGSVTLTFAITRKNVSNVSIHYPEEKIMVG